MNPASIIAKINSIAAKYGPLETRTVYKRTLFESGGNSLIDRAVVQAVVDVALVPQPLFKKAPLAPSPATPTTSDRRNVLSGTDILMPDEFQFFFTATQLTTADVKSKYNTLVLKDNSGNEEHLHLLRYEAVVLSGVEIGTNAVYESVSRGSSSGLPLYTGPGNPVIPVSTLIHYNLSPAPNGVRTSFTVPVPVSPNALVVQNGLVLAITEDYTFSGTTLTFVSAPGASDSLAVYQ
jgi:hypothetical protein